MTQLWAILTLQWGTGRAQLTPYLWLATPLLEKVDFDPEIEEDPKLHGAKGWDSTRDTTECFRSAPEKLILWNSPLLQIHRKPDRLFLHLTSKQALLHSCRKRPNFIQLQNNTKLKPLTVTAIWVSGNSQVYTLPLWLEQIITDNLIRHTEPLWQMLILKNANTPRLLCGYQPARLFLALVRTQPLPPWPHQHCHPTASEQTQKHSMGWK